MQNFDQQQIRDITTTSGKISAIKHVMDTQGMRLSPAKQLVESILAGTPLTSRPVAKMPPKAFRAPQRSPRWPLLVIGLLLISSITLFAIGYSIHASHRQLLREGMPVPATVVGLQSAGRSSLAPIFEYQVNGEPKTFISSISSSPPSYNVGDTVTVFVDEADSDRLLVDDFFHRWMVPMILGIFGAALFLPIGILTVFVAME